MSKAKYTPGPWTWFPAVNKTKDPMMGFSSHVCVGEKETAGNVLATVVMGGDGAVYSNAACVEANAALIAAAPSMYEALKTLVEHVKHHDIPLGSGIREMIDSAIKKATL